MGRNQRATNKKEGKRERESTLHRIAHSAGPIKARVRGQACAGVPECQRSRSCGKELVPKDTKERRKGEKEKKEEEEKKAMRLNAVCTILLGLPMPRVEARVDRLDATGFPAGWGWPWMSASSRRGWRARAVSSRRDQSLFFSLHRERERGVGGGGKKKVVTSNFSSASNNSRIESPVRPRYWMPMQFQSSCRQGS